MLSQLTANKYLRGAFALALLLLLTLWLYKCQSPIPAPIPSNLRPDIARRDSFIEVVKYRDSVRVEYVTKWRAVKYTDTIPCETLVHEIIAICDTVILKDSLTIGALKDVITQDSVIISKAMERITSDSVLLAKSTRKLKTQKLLTKAAFITGLGLGGFAGFKLQ